MAGVHEYLPQYLGHSSSPAHSRIRHLGPEDRKKAWLTHIMQTVIPWTFSCVLLCNRYSGGDAGHFSTVLCTQVRGLASLLAHDNTGSFFFQ